MEDLRKYPRTQHIQGSRLMSGDEDLEAVPFSRIAGRHLVVEEKVDGANAGISFSDSGELHLQSRGHYLTGGYGERHFALMKQWAAHHAPQFYNVLGPRFVLYGEWLYAKHTVFYDALPHYFMEFDVLDRETDVFLSTPRRQALLAPLAIAGVRILHEGMVKDLKSLVAMLGDSPFKSPSHREALVEAARCARIDSERVAQETDSSSLMEGLYIKVEDEERVVERYKYVRADFTQMITANESHWQSRPILPNQLRANADLFSFATYRVAQ